VPSRAICSIMTRKKHAGGRPTLYRPEFGEKIAEAMATGLSAEAAASSVGISARSLYEWQSKHDEFAQAIQEGRQRALLWWEGRALALADGAPGSAQIVSLGLRNRSRSASGWVETQKLEHTGADGGPMAVKTARLDFSTLTADERAVLRTALLKVKAATMVRG
jgi:hypothetical protein